MREFLRFEEFHKVEANCQLSFCFFHPRFPSFDPRPFINRGRKVVLYANRSTNLLNVKTLFSRGWKISFLYK